MTPPLQRLRRRIQTILSFAATGQDLPDRLTLALAGLARHRPFGDNSAYARLGRQLTPPQPPRIKAAGGQRIALDLSRLEDPMIFEEIFVDRTYPMEKVPFIPDLVIDCGAFCGMFSLLARSHFPTAEFIAFEPEPGNFQRLSGNLAINQAPVEAIRAAVGISDGTVRFSGGGFGGHMVGDQEQGGITVSLVSLSRILRERQPQRLVLKLDVEGAEREILPDILPLLPPQTVIFIETHHDEDECQRYLRPCIDVGFTHELIRNRLPENQPTLFLERMLVRNQTPIRHFCTYFDSNYTALGLTLYFSLRRHCKQFKLWVLCLDETCRQKLEQLALPGVIPISLDEFEQGDTALKAAKNNRSVVEYYFTCTPSLPLFLLRRKPEIDLITYLDSDLFFYDDPEVVFARIGQKSVAIIPHRFSPAVRHLEENGIFNVGWLSFRRDASGLACLEDWRARCLEWCYLRHELGRYADQKYLDDWPARFPNVSIIELKGANLALWNIANHHVTLREGRVMLDDEPLIFFHFHGLRRPRSWLFSLSTTYYKVSSSHALLWGVLIPYVQLLTEVESRHDAGCQPGRHPQDDPIDTLTALQKLRLTASIFVNLLRRNSVIVAFGKVIALP